MESKRDKQAILGQLKSLKKNHEAMVENLSALELLLVDDNNGRPKDPHLAKNIQALSDQVSSLAQDINSLKNTL